MPEVSKILIDTDILVDHLTCEVGEESLLEKLMQFYICFTTVINAGELYYAADTKEELDAVNKLLRSLKVLGMNSRYSMLVPHFKNKTNSLRDALLCALAKNNKLPLLTNKKEKYKFADIELIDPKLL